jgi:hypothetical protein
MKNESLHAQRRLQCEPLPRCKRHPHDVIVGGMQPVAAGSDATGVRQQSARSSTQYSSGVVAQIGFPVLALLRCFERPAVPLQRRFRHAIVVPTPPILHVGGA